MACSCEHHRFSRVTIRFRSELFLVCSNRWIRFDRFVAVIMFKLIVLLKGEPPLNFTSPVAKRFSSWTQFSFSVISFDQLPCRC